MYDILAVTIMIASLLVGLWCFVPATRDRWITQAHVVGLGIVELIVVIQAVIATVRVISGERPTELATFIGYLLTYVATVPLGLVLSFMERTRWGAVIAGAAAIIVVVLTLRLQQLWWPLHG